MSPLFRALLRLYPEAFRRRHGDEMWQTCRDRLDAERRHGRAAALGVWRGEIADHLRAARAERAADRRLRRRAALAAGAGSRRTTMMIDTLAQDLRFGARQLRRRPGFTLVAVLTLALGIGANAAVFTVVDGVLLRPLPYPQADRIVALQTTTASGIPASLSPADFRDYQRDVSSLAHAAAFTRADVALTGAGEPQRLTGTTVTPGFFDVMGVAPAIGRPFTTTDPNDAGYVMLAHGLWQRAFGGDPAIVGRAVTLDAERYVVVGVMPPGFDFPDKSQFWIPLAFTPHQLEDSQRGARWIQAVARLAPGTPVAAANADVATLAGRLATQYPDKDARYGARVTPLLDTLVANVRPALLVLQAAVLLVLLVACANVANLFLVRAAGRRTEVAIRASIGAGRARLVRQFLTESLLLAVVGGAAGLLLATWGVRALLALDPTALPRADSVGLAPSVFAFTAAVALIAGLVFGAVPAAQLARTDLQATLREGGRQAGGGRRLRGALVVAEMALALVLAAGAGLLVRSFYNLQHVDKGYDANGVLTFSLALPEGAYPTPASVLAFYHQLLPSLDAVPGVEAAGMIFGLPLGDFNGHSTFSIEGRRLPDEDAQNAYVRVIGGEYFRTMRIPLRDGRRFTNADGPNAPPVAILNETAARRYFAGQSALGHRLRLHASFVHVKYGFREIVGVVGDVKHRGLADATDPEVYIPYDQQPMDFGVVVARTRADPLSVVGGVKGRIHELDPALPIADVLPMRTIVADSVANDRFITILLALFAGLALGLAAIGIYGVMSYAVAQRTREIGVRMALGAARADVLRLVAREGLRLSALGVAIGLAASVAATRGLTALLFGVTAGDPLTYAAVAAVLVATALAACYVPARRAARVDPLVALRYE